MTCKIVIFILATYLDTPPPQPQPPPTTVAHTTATPLPPKVKEKHWGNAEGGDHLNGTVIGQRYGPPCNWLLNEGVLMLC
jgi:hypothetical protein